MKLISNARTIFRDHPFLPAMISMGWNLTYALFNGILGLIYSSWWFVTLFAFYAILGLMRLSAVTVHLNSRRTETSIMRHNGAAMIFLSIVLVGMMLLTIRERQNPVRNRIIMITIAAYTFFLVAWSIRSIVKAKRQHSASMITLRNISCASAIGSVLSLERAMLGTFGKGGDDFNRMIEAVTGAAAFVLIIIIGVSMMLTARRFEKEAGKAGKR